MDLGVRWHKGVETGVIRSLESKHMSDNVQSKEELVVKAPNLLYRPRRMPALSQACYGHQHPP